ncbi:MAG: sugar ABC transporter permease [bacterium]|nr:sugar ABC transporter permease [bacterium]
MEIAQSSSSSTVTPTGKGFSLQRRQQIWGWVFLSPWLIGLICFTVLPMFASLLFSFLNFKLGDPGNIYFNNFGNYEYLLKDPLLGPAFMSTLKFALIALPLSIIVPIGLAALLNSKHLIGRPIFRTLFYMPYIVPVVSSAYIWSGVLNTDSGWLNRILFDLGLGKPNWLFDINLIYPALNIIGLWGVGNAMLIMLASMQGVPTELYEAARVDGAGGLTIFRRITFPMISPVVFYNLILSVIGIFRYFEVPYILKEGTGDPGNSTLFYNIHLYKNAFGQQDMGYGSTLAWLMFVIAMGMTLFLFATARYWVYYGSGEQA